MVDTDEWDYTFKGWSNSLNGSIITIESATCDASYYAIVEKERIVPTISYENMSDGETVKSYSSREVEKLCASCENIGEFERNQIKYYSSYIQLLIANSSKEGEELKEEINGYYKQAFLFVEELKGNYSDLQQIKDYALSQLDELYNSLKVINNVVPSDLVKLYNDTKNTIMAIASVATAKNIINSAIESFRDAAVIIVKSFINTTIASLKQKAKDLIDGSFESLLNSISNSTLKNMLQNYKDELFIEIEEIDSIQKANTFIEEAPDKIKNFAKELLDNGVKAIKDNLLETLNYKKEELLSLVQDSEVVVQLRTTYNSIVIKINNIESLTNIDSILSEIKDDLKLMVEDIVKAELNVLANKSKEYISELINSALNKIEDQQIKTKLNDYKTLISGMIDDIDSLEDFESEVSKIKIQVTTKISEEITAQVTKYKDAALDEIEDLINTFIQKISNETIQADATSYLNEQIALINAISSIDDCKNTINTIKTNTIDFISSETTVIISEYKEDAIAKLDEAINALVAKISDEELQKSVSNFSKVELAKINAVETLDDVKNTATEVANDISTFVSETLASELLVLKTKACNALKDLKDQALTKITDSTLADDVSSFYDDQVDKIDAITKLDDVDDTTKSIKDDFITFITQKITAQLLLLKTNALTELNTLITTAINKLSDQSLKDRLNTFKTQEIAVINECESIDSIGSTINTVKTDTQNFISSIIAEQLSSLKTLAISEFNDTIDSLLENVTDEDVKKSISDFAKTEIAKYNSVNSLEGLKTTTSEVAEDLEEFAKDIAADIIANLKTKAIQELDKVVAAYLDRLNNNTLKQQLNTYYNQAKTYINSVNDISTAVKDIADKVKDVTLYGLELVASQIAALRQQVKGYISDITASIGDGVYDFIPDSMEKGYAPNLVTLDEVTYDFTNFVNISDIKYGGFGSVWHNVISSIDKCDSLYKLFDSSNGVMAEVLVLINSYLDDKYSDTLDKTIEKDSYTIELSFENNCVSLIVTTYNKNKEQSSQIQFNYDVTNEVKTIKIIVGASSLKTISTSNSFTLAFKVSISGVSYSSQMEISKNNNIITGNLYSIIANGTTHVTNFVFKDNYGYVCNNVSNIMELYNTNTGKLVAYEIYEDFVLNQYDTLWFNLNDISNITSIKVLDHTKTNPSTKSEYDVYLNGSNSLLSIAMSSDTLAKSRIYDVEYRSQYFYYIDEETQTVKEIAVEVPMMFIQANGKKQHFTNFATLFVQNNSINANVLVSSTDLDKLTSSYSTAKSNFMNVTSSVTVDTIDAYLAQ